jgi:hypothetical protein
MCFGADHADLDRLGSQQVTQWLVHADGRRPGNCSTRRAACSGGSSRQLMFRLIHLIHGFFQCPRAFFSRMILALAVHLKGLGLALRSVSQVSMAAWSSATEVEALLAIRQILLHRAGVDVVKRDPPENILRRISKHDNGGVSRLVDNFPVAAQ